MPPALFGYMATGAEDEMTLRANRESFHKFMLRLRRVGRCQQYRVSNCSMQQLDAPSLKDVTPDMVRRV